MHDDIKRKIQQAHVLKVYYNEQLNKMRLEFCHVVADDVLVFHAEIINVLVLRFGISF